MNSSRRFALLAQISLVLAAISYCAYPACSQTPGKESLIRYVDPFIGTAAHGHVYPGATVPFGMVQLSPDNGTQGWDWCAGYNYEDQSVVGFSHTHLSGTGIGDLCDLLVMPSVQRHDLTPVIQDAKKKPYAATFSHSRESASPGYYTVAMDNGVRAELTANTYCGVHRYTFPSPDAASLVIDLSFAINWDRPTSTNLKWESPTLLTGYRHSSGWAKDQRFFFAIAFSHPVRSMEVVDSVWQRTEQSQAGEGTRAQLFFSIPSQQSLEIQVGISSASTEGALAGLETIKGKSFDLVRQEAESEWEKELGKIRFESADASLKTLFYTSLYRTALAPVQFSDARGEYWGPDGKIHRTENYRRYDIFSLWDTFRAANPLYTLTQPDKVNDMVQSLLDHYLQYGLLPVWSLLGNETNTMTGYHAIPVLVDAFSKGFRNYDVDLAYQSLLTSAAQNIRGSNFYREYGYIPHEKEGESVTKTLEYGFDDWCIAEMARALGKTEDEKAFRARAQAYKHLFDPQTGFMRAKKADGSWKTPFDPKFSDHNFDVAEYTEGNAWQHSWFVLHDIPGLIQLHGGDQAFIRKLDQLFSESSEITGENKSSDISGLIGQYAHGNEPSHHIAFMYNYAGAPWKSQAQARQIMTTQYNTTPAGLCGNEDCGQMSAWYVFSALGIYPVNPASGVYVLGSPMFDQAEIPLAGGKTFRLEALNNGLQHPYIQSATLNGRKLKQSFITHQEILAGGELVLKMGPQPNTRLWSRKSGRPK
ncbi:MAG: GH92 family glycosyl hydrolase [Haliscomenobacter sp.]|nr:GH92 family glycosyl hydrolase [Haliscomenobacter sp.]